MAWRPLKIFLDSQVAITGLFDSLVSKVLH